MRMTNIVFLVGFSYPQGMAGTKDAQHIIDGLKTYPDVSIHVVVLRQSSSANMLAGVHRGIPYETIMGDALRYKMMVLAPIFYARAKQTIRRLFRHGQKNVLYVWPAPTFDNIPIVHYARRIGYKTVFDIVEDDDAARTISRSFRQRMQNAFARRVTHHIVSLADGIVVISSRLETKFQGLVSGLVPIHRRWICVDVDRYAQSQPGSGDRVTLFYSGSFGVKDGVSVLLDAFDMLASKRENVWLVLTGTGDGEDMRVVLSRINASPHKDRIVYKGYLDDNAYYAALNVASIPCMTRTGIAYAQAGFPFKLGEYLATGKPVIASAVSDVPCLLRDRYEAMLVPPSDSGAIVKAVEYLIAHPDEGCAIGLRGREVARRWFCHRSQAKSLYDFISTV